MATIAKLVAELSLEDNKFIRGIDSARQHLDDLGKSARNVGKDLTGKVTLPLLAAATVATKWAASNENAIGKSNQVFDTAAQTVLDWSRTTGSAFGIAETDALQMAGTYGALFNLMGQTNDVSAEYSMQLVELSADMAAFNDVSQDRTSEAIMAGLTGEYESLKRLGVFLNETMVAEEALAIARAEGRSEITEADKALARYNLIMEQTAQQAGQFEREQNSLNGRLAVGRARLKNLGTTIGYYLIPPLVKGLEAIGRLFDYLESLSPATLKWAIIIAGLAAAMGPLLIVIGMMLPGLSALLGIIAALASPIGLLVVAVAALAYIFRDDLLDALGWVVDRAREVIDTFRDMRELGLDPVQAALAALALVFPALGSVIAPLRQMVDNLTDAFRAFTRGNFSEGFNRLWEAVRNLGSAFLAIGQAALDAVRSIDWSDVIATIRGALSSIDLGQITLNILGWIPKAAKTAWDFLTGWVLGTDTGLGGDGTGGARPTRTVSFGTVALQIAGWAITSLASLPEKLYSTVKDAIDSVAWYKLGYVIGEKIRGLFDNLSWDGIMKAGEAAINAFRDAMTNPKFWIALGLALAALVIGLPALIVVGAVLLFKDAAAELLAGFLDGINVNWLAIALWFTAVPGKIRSALGDLWDALTQKGKDLIAGLWTGILEVWDTFIDWIGTIKDLLIQKFPEPENWLLDIGKSLLAGLWAGILEVWETFTTWVEGIEQLLIGKFPNPETWLVDIGKDLIAGIKSGAEEKWDDFVGWLEGVWDALPGWVRDFWGWTFGGGGGGGGGNDTQSSGIATFRGDVDTVLTILSDLDDGMKTSVDVSKLMRTGMADSFDKLRSSGEEKFNAVRAVVSAQSDLARANALKAALALRDGMRQHFTSVETDTTERMRNTSSKAMAELDKLQLRAGLAMAQLKSTMASRAQEAADAVRSAMAMVPVHVANAGATAVAVAGNIGRQIGSALANGMLSMLATVRSAATAIINEANRAAMKAAMIRSPSRIWLEYGELMAEGLAMGLDHGERDAARAAADVVHAANTMLERPQPDLSTMARQDGPGLSNQDRPIIQIITLEPGKWKEFLEAAQAGGEFAKGFGAGLGLHEGMA